MLADTRRRDPEAGGRLWAFIYERMALPEVPVSNLSELARKADVDRGTLYAWRDGRRPEIDAGPKVAAALGTTYQELMRRRSGHDEPRVLLQVTPDQLADLVEQTTERVLERLRRDAP